MPELKILAVGDVVGSPGRAAVKGLLPGLIRSEGIGFAVVNGENAAGGSGLTPSVVAEIFAAGAGCLTTGDHVYKNRDVMAVIDKEPRLLRPANFPKRAAGRGWGVYRTTVAGSGFPVPGSQPTTLNLARPPCGGPEPGTLNPQIVKVAVINLLGRSFMGAPADNPFERAEAILEELTPEAPDAILVDFHAEATAEKISMARFLDGRVAAVWGTHTHVPTADETVLARGTGYITDIGMTGGHDSIIGRRTEEVLETMVTGMPTRWEVAETDVRLSGAIFTLETSTGRCTAVRRVQVKLA